jgi:hypothetical protein
MTSATYWLRTPQARQNALAAIQRAAEGMCITIAEPRRRNIQNDAAHAALQDIANQLQWHGRKLSVLVWKRLTIASFLRELGERVELIPALDGNGFDVIYEHSSEFGIKKCSAWIEWIYAFGTQNGVVFRDKGHSG